MRQTSSHFLRSNHLQFLVSFRHIVFQMLNFSRRVHVFLASIRWFVRAVTMSDVLLQILVVEKGVAADGTLERKGFETHFSSVEMN